MSKVLTSYRHKLQQQVLLGGSWVVIISGVTSKVTIVITHIRGLTTTLRTTHEPPSTLNLKRRTGDPM